MITVRGLSKNFKVATKEPGLVGSIRSLFHRQYQTKEALRNVSLEIHQGEMLGLIGANGAGKTTLVKILAGIIHPSQGHVRVLGMDPWERDNQLRRQMALIMGQKAQLWYDLPALDSYLLLKEIYQIDERLYHQQIEFLADVLNIKDQLKIQVRKLSLGERMKVELMGALLHRPMIIYLDEPTIGLDIMAQKAVRKFLKEYQREFRPIILLTSHYMEDIKELCQRVVLIKSGELVYDGSLGAIQGLFGDKKKITLTLDHPPDQLPALPRELGLFDVQLNRVSINTTKLHLNAGIEFLIHHFQSQDITIQDPPIEEVIEHYLSKGHS